MATNASTEPQQQLAPTKDDPRSQYQGFVDRLTTQVIAAMPLSVPDEDLKRARARFRVAFSADAQGQLSECTPESVARAIVMSALSGLFPGGPRPDVWLIPRRNKERDNQLEVNWQMSFRGYIRLARRAGWELEPVLVYSGEEFKIEEGDTPRVTHVRNLDLPKTWEAIRYVYVRVYPQGKRSEARIAYLTKEEVLKRRRKAQSDKIWAEWPLEMTYKTIVSYAGNRELFPTDDPARYAMEASERTEIGTGSASTEWSQLPPGEKTKNLAQRLGAGRSEGGAVIETEGRPVDLTGMPQGESVGAAADLFEQAAARPGEMLSPGQVQELMTLVKTTGVSMDELEGAFGGRLDKVTIRGKDAKQLEAAIIAEIRSLVATGATNKSDAK